VAAACLRVDRWVAAGLKKKNNLVLGKERA
jgi:hypothetical protein